MKDEIKCTILEDGTIKMETDKVSDANHVNAENLVKELSKLGKTEVKQKKGHAHHHQHGGVYHKH